MKNEQGSEESDSEYGTQSIRAWPAHFDVETVGLIEPEPLRDKPVLKKAESLQGFLSKNDSRAEKI